MKKIKKRNKGTWFYIGFVVCVVALYFLVTNVSYWLTKRTFSKIDKDMDALVASWQTSFPEATVTKDKYCANDQEKFGGGRLECIIDVIITLEPRDKDGESPRVFTKALEGNFSSEDPLRLQAGFAKADYVHTSTKSSCFASYTLPNSLDSKLNLDFYCIRPVNRAVYPRLTH